MTERRGGEPAETFEDAVLSVLRVVQSLIDERGAEVVELSLSEEREGSYLVRIPIRWKREPGER